MLGVAKKNIAIIKIIAYHIFLSGSVRNSIKLTDFRTIDRVRLRSPDAQLWGSRSNLCKLPMVASEPGMICVQSF